jgi:hypothetical protein
MIGDFMTKPLQGTLFWKFRDQIMGVIPAWDPGLGKPKPGNGKLDTHELKPRKGKKQQQEVWSRWKGGTTGVCRE